MARIPFTKEDLTHPPITLIDLVSANDHKVTRSHMENRSLSVNSKATRINSHGDARQYTCTDSHDIRELATTSREREIKTTPGEPRSCSTSPKVT